MPRYRYIDWPEYGELTEALAERVRSGGRRVDVVVGVARGGIPVALVVADRLGKRFEMLRVESYRGIGKRTRPTIVTPIDRSAVERLAVLLVDDLVDSGETMLLLQRSIKKMGAKSVETAVLFKKPWSRVEPTYYLEGSREWIVFPFEVGEVARLRSKTRRTAVVRPRTR